MIHDIEKMKRVLRDRNKMSIRRGYIGDLTLEQWIETVEEFNGLCAYCGEAPYVYMEHYISGGSTTKSNCVPTCAACNVRKDSTGKRREFYENQNVLDFLIRNGAKIHIHHHSLKVIQKQGEQTNIFCENCSYYFVPLGDKSIEDLMEQCYWEESMYCDVMEG